VIPFKRAFPLSFDLFVEERGLWDFAKRKKVSLLVVWSASFFFDLKEGFREKGEARENEENLAPKQ